MNSFQAFRLQSSILKGLKKHSVNAPTTEQKTIFKALSRQNDLVINATPDMGPEVGYLLTTLNEIASQQRKGGTRVLILTEDRERAEALQQWVLQIGEFAGIQAAFLSPDQDEKSSITTLASGPAVLISTPANFASVLESAKMIFREVTLFVIEKADEIEDWSAIEGVSRRILSKCQKVFIASKDSQKLRDAEASILTEPELIKVLQERSAPEAPPVSKDLTQYYINVPPRSKITTLIALLKDHSTRSNLIFTASGRTADKLYKALRKNDFRAVSLSKSLDSETFEKRRELFTEHKVQHLIVGDYSAAEIQLNDVEQVINYDVPEDVNEYKLRADLVKDGKASKILSLVSKQDRSDILTICDELGYAPEEVPVPESVLQKLNGESGAGSVSDATDKTERQGASVAGKQAGGSSKGTSSKGTSSKGAKDRDKGQGRRNGRGKGRPQNHQQDGDHSAGKEKGKNSRGGHSNRTQKPSRSDRPARSGSRGRGRNETVLNRQKIDVSALPQPTFEQLTGGRSGKKKTEKKNSILSRLKSLFGRD